MESMLFVYVDDQYRLTLCDIIATNEGVETVFELDGRDPDYIILARPFLAESVAEDVRTLTGVTLVNVRSVQCRQEGGRRIIDVDDIPGPLPVPSAQLRSAQPVITSADMPGPRPAMRAARVHRDVSSQAGLATMAGMRGFGSGLPELGKLSY